jgi:hypothetical protein
VVGGGANRMESSWSVAPIFPLEEFPESGGLTPRAPSSFQGNPLDQGNALDLQADDKTPYSTPFC